MNTIHPKFLSQMTGEPNDVNYFKTQSRQELIEELVSAGATEIQANAKLDAKSLEMLKHIDEWQVYFLVETLMMNLYDLHDDPKSLKHHDDHQGEMSGMRLSVHRCWSNDIPEIMEKYKIVELPDDHSKIPRMRLRDSDYFV